MLPPRTMFFFGLNGLRVLSLISLILVFSSTILVMVTNIKAVNAFEASKGLDANSTEHSMVDCDYIEGSTVPNQPAGVFWAVVASLLIIFQTIALFLSEISWPMSFFDRFFPVLGSNFGTGALGIFQGLISTQILSHHVDDFTLVSAFFLFAIGCLNMFFGLIFRASGKERRSVRVWRAEAKGVLPTSQDNRPVFSKPSPVYVSNMFGGDNEKGYPQSDISTWKSTEKAGYGFGRQGEKVAGLRGFMLQKPEESLPRYVSPAHSPTRKPLHLSRPHSRSSESDMTDNTSVYESRQAVLRDAILAEQAMQPPRALTESDYGSRPTTPQISKPVFKSSTNAI